MTLHYFNTTNEVENLPDYQNKALRQEIRVLGYFQSNPGRWYTAEDISSYVLTDAPITSARRAISRLYKAGKLKRGAKKIGFYKRPIYYWGLV